ncbi:hypothetical protein GYMLUDRAFT_578131 [Collybiopsis luxurians FD-317 M1]|uniref:Unplaced genomic scaffold GYMLUscaffold_22, whole genome shotgun sequence n=1 Tax=Collybiopsis luxurians FD-317 M1 TaxID=944289 RepID=A0A0D0C0T6_9AGAR|nr:hypothetical protein GYMLUDRAFT_578131 [Collybiopsis luxurians FD-317 M1]
MHSSTRWDIAIPVHFDHALSSLCPRSDFRAHKTVSVLILEVESGGNDVKSILIHAAFLVRLVNRFLRSQGREPTFVILAIYLTKSGKFTTHFVFESEDPEEVQPDQSSSEQPGMTTPNRRRDCNSCSVCTTFPPSMARISTGSSSSLNNTTKICSTPSFRPTQVS